MNSNWVLILIILSLVAGCLMGVIVGIVSTVHFVEERLRNFLQTLKKND